jgi:Uma2 family endonuclease
VDEAFFRLPPDWLCEVLSPRTHKIDRLKKLPIYAAVGVEYVWLVDPRDRRLDVHRRAKRSWTLVASYRGNARVRVPPFEDSVLPLSRLWEGRPPLRANEPRAAYEQL